MGWLDSFKIAVVTQNTEQISALLDTMPQFDTVEEMQKALYLIKEGYILVDTLKAQTRTQLETIKKNIEFLESTAKAQENSLDVSY